jgi:MFS family permease
MRQGIGETMFNKENIFNKSMMREIVLLFIAIALIGFSSGIIENIQTNFFTAIGMSTDNRAQMEIPREVPGLVQSLIIAALSLLTIGRMGSVAMFVRTAGLMCIGLFVTQFNWLFVAFAVTVSLGEHIFMPLRNSIGITIANHGYEGRVLGLMDAATTILSLVASLIVLFLFDGTKLSNYHTFYIITAVVSLGAGVALFFMRTHKGSETIRRPRLVFKKKYSLYYIISFVSGFRKQIYLIFAPWLLVYTFGQSVQSMTLLYIIGSVSVFFVNPTIGHLIDRHGERRLLVTGGFICIAVYILYALLCTADKASGVVVLVLFALSFIDRMTLSTLIGRDIFVKHTADTPEEIMPTLSLGVSMDHVASITSPLISALVWREAGPQWVFIIGAVIGAIYTGVCFLVPKKKAGTPEIAEQIVTDV